MLCGCEVCRLRHERHAEAWRAEAERAEALRDGGPVGEVPAVTRDDLAQGGVFPGSTAGPAIRAQRLARQWDREREARADAVDRARAALDPECRRLTADELLKVARWIVTGEDRLEVPTYVFTDEDRRGGRKLWRR